MAFPKALFLPVYKDYIFSDAGVGVKVRFDECHARTRIESSLGCFDILFEALVGPLGEVDITAYVK